MLYRLIYSDVTELMILSVLVFGLFQSSLMLFLSFIHTFADVPLAPIPCGYTALEAKQ